MTDEEQISPEEKLLKVIQEPEGQEEVVEAKVAEPVPVAAEPVAKAVAPAPAPAKAEPAPEPKAEEAPVEETPVAEAKADVAPDKEKAEKKPKLKVKKADPAEKEPKSGGLIGAGGPTVIEGTKRKSGKFGLKSFNKGLVAAAIVLFCLTCLDVGVFAYKTQKDDLGLSALENPDAPETGTQGVSEVEDPSSALIGLPKLLSIFENHPIFRLPGIQKPDDKNGRKPPPPAPSKKWMKTAKGFKVIGVSKMPGGSVEVIVTDSKRGMMFFTPLKKLVVDDVDLTIEETGENFAVIGDGTDKVRID